MRNKSTSLASITAILLVPLAAAAQGSATNPPATWPPPTATTPTPAPAYPAPTYYPAPAPAYPAPAPTPAPAPAPAPSPAPAPAYPAPAPNYWNPAPAPTPAPAPAAPAPVVAPVPAPAPAPVPASVAAPAPAPAPAPIAAPAPAVEVKPEAPAETAPPAKTVVTETDERPKGFIAQPSLAGSVGLLHMSSANAGNVGQLRLSLHGEFFQGSDFLVKSDSPVASDRDTRLQGALTFGITPIEHLEIFGAVLGSANRNRRLCTSDSDCSIVEANRTDPELIKSFGDLILGGKVAYPVADGFSAAGELGIRMMSSITGISFSPSSTSLWLNAIGTYDLKPVTNNVPLRFHLNVGYYFDQSGNLVDYNANNTSAFSRYVSKFAYGMSGNRFRLAVGADAPLDELTEGFSLRPLLEYHFEYLNNDADPVILAQEHSTCGQANQAACKDNKDLHWVTLGVQAQVLHGLTLTAGLDIALRSPGFAYAPALVPWNLLFGLGFPMDLVPHVVRNVSVEKVVAKETMSEGLVAGRVINSTGAPVEGAVVGVTGREHSRVLTEADGTFQSVPLAPGQVELVVNANGYETATVRTEVVAGQTANIVLRLAAKAPAARVYGRVSDDSGKGIVASLKLAGPQLAETKSDESGNFSVAVPQGLYAVRVDAEPYLSKELQVQVAEGRDNALSVVLHTRPAISGVSFKDGKIKLKQPIVFKAGKKPTAELGPGMPLLLDEVVDLLVNHSEIRQVRVEAHWDSSLPAAQAQALTDDQAKAVVKYLVDQGVAADRLVAEGMGAKKPIVPNLGKGKIKNRRVELVVP